MSTYCRIVVHKSLAEIESALLQAFDADNVIAEPDARPEDFILSEGNACVALDEHQSGSFLQYIADEPQFLTNLSKNCDSKITAIAVQTGVGFVSILVVDRGNIIRRYSECESNTEIDEGQLPDWDDRIRDHAWNAADDIVGILPWTPEPSIVGTALRQIGRSIGLISKKQPEKKPVVTPSGLIFGDPVGAIPTERYHAKLNLKATECVIVGFRLVCSLDSGNELIVSPGDIEKPFSNPFTHDGTYLAFRDGRTMSLPDTVEFSEIVQWCNTNEA